MKQGIGYLGSERVMISTSANWEVLPPKPQGWTKGYSLYKFHFINYAPCGIIINGTTELFLDKRQGFFCDQGDKEITSFVIKEADISYVWGGAY